MTEVGFQSQIIRHRKYMKLVKLGKSNRQTYALMSCVSHVKQFGFLRKMHVVRIGQFLFCVHRHLKEILRRSHLRMERKGIIMKQVLEREYHIVNVKSNVIHSFLVRHYHLSYFFVIKLCCISSFEISPCLVLHLVATTLGFVVGRLSFRNCAPLEVMCPGCQLYPKSPRKDLWAWSLKGGMIQ